MAKKRKSKKRKGRRKGKAKSKKKSKVRVMGVVIKVPRLKLPKSVS
jgi:hypothetical protein